MKSTGIVRRIDDLGRIVIPKELRQTYGIDEGDPVEVFTSEHGIVFRKYEPGCTFCGSVAIAKLVRRKPVCSDCITEIGR